MRLIATLQDERQGNLLSDYLKSQNIDNVLDVSTGHDWGEDSYGVTTYTVWVIEEENLVKALEIARDFAANSKAPRFQQPWTTPPSPTIETLSSLPEEAVDTRQPVADQSKTPKRIQTQQLKPIEPMGKATLYLLMLCCLLFVFTETTAPTPPQAEARAFSKQSLPMIPLYYSTIKKELLFDYPHAYEIVDEIIAQTELDRLQVNSELPGNLSPLIAQFQHTPYWSGFYDKIVALFQKKEINWHVTEPLFEKLQQGEVWRLLSPIFLHADIFHLLFNMIWLAVLGKQLEQRMGWGRYLLFIGLTGIITNTCQYLMTGSNFLGFSGVICAMITFVWIRQKKTPWEGYLLQSATFNFALLFLFIILILQLASFYTEIAYTQPIAPQIANTAHMTGLFLGLILGNSTFFAWKHH